MVRTHTPLIALALITELQILSFSGKGQSHVSYGAIALGGDYSQAPIPSSSMSLTDEVTLTVTSNGNTNFTLNDNLNVTWSGSSSYSPTVS